MNLLIGLHISLYKQDEETALMLASRQGSFGIVELLVDNGADWMASNKVLTWFNIAAIVITLLLFLCA
jgi:ankyrin repeat protein